MTKEMIRAKANDIAMMDENELQEFGASVDTSFLDGKSKMFLYESIEKRQVQLQKNEELQGASVVASELKVGEI